MLIDKTRPEFIDVPESLDGEVLLERVYDPGGALMGYITASKESAAAMKTKSDAELEEAGWLRYKDILTGI